MQHVAVLTFGVFPCDVNEPPVFGDGACLGLKNAFSAALISRMAPI